MPHTNAITAAPANAPAQQNSAAKRAATHVHSYAPGVHSPGARAPGFPSHVDTVIIGAGSAGLSAARRLESYGRSVLILEADTRIGGRAHTDTTTFSDPTDLGCAWLHQADRNPYTALAQARRFQLLPHDDAHLDVFRDGARLSTSDVELFGRAVTRIQAAIMAHRGADVSLTTLLSMPPFTTMRISDWTEHAPQQAWANMLAQVTLGALDAGANAEQLSVHGVQQHGSTQPNWMMQEGFGTLVAQLGQGLPIALGERVQEIDYSGRGVRVKTTGGVVTADHCIVTVSTGVLQSEAIRFLPALPAATLKAIDNLPMGHFNKVILELDDRIEGLSPGSWIVDARTTEDNALNFLCHPFGTNQVIALAGGRYGKTLSTMAQHEAVIEATETLAQCMGGLQGHVVNKGLATTWANNPFTLGSYAYVKPGGEHARATLGMPIANKLFFAGEATTLELAQTCGGAFLAGRRAADMIAALPPLSTTLAA